MIRIYGASDDLVEFEGLILSEASDDEMPTKGVVGDGDEELGVIDHDVRITIGCPEASAGKDAHGVIVVMSYGDPRVGEAGVWVATVSPIEEDVKCPWPVRVKLNEEPSRGYSAVVEIDAPDGTPVMVKVVEP